MPLPDQIPLRYTEEDAGYVSMRPVVKQTFRLNELADMVVSVTGKDAARVQQIFRNGTVVYNGYRYSWDGISAELAEIASLLRPFPDDDPTRPFHPEEAKSVLFEMGGGSQRNVVEILRSDASEKKLFGKNSPWDVLVQCAREHPARYEKYSHARKADLYRITLPFEIGQRLLAAMLESAPRGLRHRWTTLRPPAVVIFVCPR
ncbi:MAG TPA: hypothetical protein VGF61_03760 [Candidatus Acidoferrum sp.]|jgi:hypothetical protein